MSHRRDRRTRSRRGTSYAPGRAARSGPGGAPGCPGGLRDGPPVPDAAAAPACAAQVSVRGPGRRGRRRGPARGRATGRCSARRASDIADPDWFLDPVTGRRAPQDRLAFRIDHRDENETGNVKPVWELSRHHHLTVLAAAWWLTGDEPVRRARRPSSSGRGGRPTRSCPGCTGPAASSSGSGSRAWVWVRRLLDDWSRVGGPVRGQRRARCARSGWHQRLPRRLPQPRLVGQQPRRGRGRRPARRRLRVPVVRRERRVARRRGTASSSGSCARQHLRRAASTASWPPTTTGSSPSSAWSPRSRRAPPGHPLAAPTRGRCSPRRSTRPPPWSTRPAGRRARATATRGAHWSSTTPRRTRGASCWAWARPCSARSPGGRTTGSRMSRTVAPRARSGRSRPEIGGRPTDAPRAFADAGIDLLRTPAEDGPEIWCRCDGGPHGFLSIAAHAHADALSVEVRHGGVDVLVDPGTYCYHGDPEWRSYFRSTLAHNTARGRREQPVRRGRPVPVEHAHARTRDERSRSVRCATQTWTAHHTGYARLDPALRHTRTVTLDSIDAPALGPDVVTGERVARRAARVPPRARGHGGAGGGRGRAALARRRRGPSPPTLDLPRQLHWAAHRGETDPILGWYSPRFGERVPTTTLLGTGTVEGSLELLTTLDFAPDRGVRTAHHRSRRYR